MLSLKLQLLVFSSMQFCNVFLQYVGLSEVTQEVPLPFIVQLTGEYLKSGRLVDALYHRVQGG